MALQRTVPKGAKLCSRSLLGVSYSYPGSIFVDYPGAIELQHFCIDFRKNAKKMRPKQLVEWALKEIG